MPEAPNKPHVLLIGSTNATLSWPGVKGNNCDTFVTNEVYDLFPNLIVLRSCELCIEGKVEEF